MKLKRDVYMAFWNWNWGTHQRQDQKMLDYILDAYPSIDMVTGVETKVDNFHQMFPKGWRVVQNIKNLSKRNVMIAWVRLSLHRPKVRGLKLGVNPNGVKMLPRPLRIVDFQLYSSSAGRYLWCRLILGHNAPKRFKFLQPVFNARVKLRIKARSWGRKGRWVYLADHNQNGNEVAKILGGTFHGEGIDGPITGPNMTMKNVVIDNKPKHEGWTDHLGVVGTLKLKD